MSRTNIKVQGIMHMYDALTAKYNRQYLKTHLIQIRYIYNTCTFILLFSERALYCFECAFHPRFSLTQGTCRLDYRRPENRYNILLLADTSIDLIIQWPENRYNIYNILFAAVSNLASKHLLA